MIVTAVTTTLAIALLACAPGRAQEALLAYKSLSLEIALELARAALTDCRQRGFQVAVAVVDRFGVTQVVLRDRFAGPHTPRPRRARRGPRSAFAPTPPTSSPRPSRERLRRAFANSGAWSFSEAE